MKIGIYMEIIAPFWAWVPLKKGQEQHLPLPYELGHLSYRSQSKYYYYFNINNCFPVCENFWASFCYSLILIIDGTTPLWWCEGKSGETWFSSLSRPVLVEYIINQRNGHRVSKKENGSNVARATFSWFPNTLKKTTTHTPKMLVTLIS